MSLSNTSLAFRLFVSSFRFIFSFLFVSLFSSKFVYLKRSLIVAHLPELAPLHQRPH